MVEKRWSHELREILEGADRAWEAAKRIDESPELPRSVKNLFAVLMPELAKVREAAQAAFGRLSSEPLAKLSAGQPLSREEYYVCQAMDVSVGTARELGLSAFDDYDVYRMLCYEDDKWRGYINVHLTPREPGDRIRLRFGRPPEQCRRRYLRSEQEAFFREQLPEVFSRFSD